MRISSRIAALTAVTAVLIPLSAGSLAAAAPARPTDRAGAHTAALAAGRAAGGLASVLRAGQRLTANRTGIGPHAELVSPSGVFSLQLQGATLELNENQTFPDGFGAGTDDWFVFLKPKHGNFLPFNKATLRMQANGDLVMYTSKGKVIWSSHTAGTGHHNLLRLQDNGNLVIYTRSGRAVWRLGTTATILKAGQSLPSGGRLVDKYLESLLGVTSLTMRADGDLVESYDGRVIWSSGTHARGAHLALRHDGDLVILARSGRLLWQSHTRGHDGYIELNCKQVSFSARVLHSHRWAAPAGPSPSCG